MSSTQARILVVDDEAVVRTTLQRMLAQAGYDVDVAEDGADAERRLAEGSYDAAILDLRMPAPDGFQILEWMRRHAVEAVPIVLSATADITDAARAVQQGAFDFVCKPIEDFRMFAHRVQRAVEYRQLRASRDHLLEELSAKNVELENRLDQLALAHSILQSQAVAIQVDLNRAMRIQHGLLPHSLPFADTLSFSAFYHPMAKVGGDLYDLAQLDDHRLGVYLADASGHGVSSAMLTVFLKHAVQLEWRRSSLDPANGPGQLLRDLNRTLIMEAFGEGVFVSMTCLEVDVETRRVRFSSAGHPPIYVRRAAGGIERLHRPAPVLGVNPNVYYADGECALESGDVLVLYTDGITEARDGTGEFFGEERLVRTLTAAGADAETITHAVETALTAFQSGYPCTDDATLLALGAAPQRAPFTVPEEDPVRPPLHRGVKVLAAKQEHRWFVSVCGMGSWRESQQIVDLCEAARKSGVRSIILDLGHCSHLDSTFLGVLHNIATSFDADPQCRFEVQNVPVPLLREMSALGLTSVLAHFRPEPVSLPESMEPVEGGIPAGEELGRLLLWAHEALIEADPSNADRFAAVLQVLHDRAKTASRDQSPPAER